MPKSFCRMKEHNMVFFFKPYKDIPAFTRGTIVHVHSDDAVEVELRLPGEERPRVCSVETSYLVETGYDRETWETMQALIYKLKSGEITVEQLREARDKHELNQKAKALCDAGRAVSMAQARRMVMAGMNKEDDDAV